MGISLPGYQEGVWSNYLVLMTVVKGKKGQRHSMRSVSFPFQIAFGQLIANWLYVVFGYDHFLIAL